MNRATADNQSAQAEDEGLEPTKEWVKDLVDEIIAEEFASPDLELVWLDEDTDAAQAEAQLESRVKLGAVTLNEMRDALGLDPFATPAADRPMVLTATGQRLRYSLTASPHCTELGNGHGADDGRIVAIIRDAGDGVRAGAGLIAVVLPLERPGALPRQGHELRVE